MLNETHDASLRSWVAGADDPATDFPIQNLPYGVFRRRGALEAPRLGVAIGMHVLDVAAAHAAGHLPGVAGTIAERVAKESTLNALMALGPAEWSAFRLALSRLLRAGHAAEADAARLLVPLEDAELLLPASVGDYTDFYASVHHATNVGSMFRPDNPLLPNYKWVPIGYHGRSSSIVVSGTPVQRPVGQVKDEGAAAPELRPSQRLDYELEIGAFVGKGNALGAPVPVARAEELLFGLVLLNDWSARDVQTWEYQPLGPFLAKNFASTISPWVVSLEALAPFRVPPAPREEGDPAPLPYLDDAAQRERGAFDIVLEVAISTKAMRDRRERETTVSRGSFARMYWTLAQLLAHHTVNGCNLRPGDLLGSGTVSGPERDSRGCLLELTWRGTEPLVLGGEQRRFLQDGDEVVLRGWCERAGMRRIGFGECRGVVRPAT